MFAPNSSRVRRLCVMLKSSANTFVTETSSHGAGIAEDAEIRTSFDCLLTIYEMGLIDPVEMLRKIRSDQPAISDLPPGTSVPLGA